VEDALRDQVDVLDVFRQQVGKPARTIAWGSSLGGMVTAALLERTPQRFDGGLAMCGVLAGTVGLWNSYLDALFVLRTFLAPEVDLVHIADPFAAIDTMGAALAAAQQTPEGRARIALAAAVADVPGWIDADLPRPDPDDVATQQAAQFEHFQTLLLFGLALRADVEARAGGNPSSNVGVDYGALLRRSNGRGEVRALYAHAGLDLGADLDVLAAAPRITADPAAVSYATANVVFDGDLHDPLLTLHTNGDQLAVVEQERAYLDTVRAAGTRSLVRQAFVERAGHCTFTPAETIAALQALIARIDDGRWRDRVDADSLNTAASALGPDLNVHFDDATGSLVPTSPAFDDRRPGPFLRPFDLA
jgi:pimeloyl-ACP methyl ester carboxylesterase